MNYPDSARSYVSYSSAFGSPQESARSRGSWDTAHLVDSGSSGEMGNGNSTGSGGITYPSSVAYPYPLDSARSRGSWETPADQFFSPRATFRSNSGSDEWITPRADNKETTPRDRERYQFKHRSHDSHDPSHEEYQYPLSPVAEAKSSYNNGLNDSYGDGDGFSLHMGPSRGNARDADVVDAKLGGMVENLLIDDDDGDGPAGFRGGASGSPNPSRRWSQSGSNSKSYAEDLGLTTEDQGDEDLGGGQVTDADLEQALAAGMIDGISEQDVEDIFSYARHGRIADVERLLDRGIPVNVRDVNGNTILTIACQNGSKRVAKCVLRRGADLNVRNYKGNTPLHYCYHYGYGESLGNYLVSKGADASLRNNAGHACYQGI